jgi:hypothetical protein
MLAFERDADGALVLAAGVPASWLDAGEVAVTGLPTPHGSLDFRLARDGDSTLVASTGGTLAMPPGGIELRPPLEGPLASVETKGHAGASFGAESEDPGVSAHVVLRF